MIVIVIVCVLIEEEALQRAEHARRQIAAQRDEQERVRPPPTSPYLTSPHLHACHHRYLSRSKQPLALSAHTSRLHSTSTYCAHNRSTSACRTAEVCCLHSTTEQPHSSWMCNRTDRLERERAESERAAAQEYTSSILPPPASTPELGLTDHCYPFVDMLISNSFIYSITSIAPSSSSTCT